MAHEMIIKKVDTEEGKQYQVGCKCGWEGVLDKEYLTSREACLVHMRDAARLRGRLDKFPD